MSMGEESAVVGVVTAVGEIGKYFGYYRSHALFLAITGNLKSFFGEMYGKVSGPSGGRAGSMHIADPKSGLMLTSAIVSSTIAPAVGAALSSKYRDANEIAVCFFGDGAVEEGVFWESLNIACLLKVPVLFVCLDNGLAVDSPSFKRQGFKSISSAISGFNLIYDHDDSSDSIKVYQKTQIIIRRMAELKLPAFIHIEYFRMLQHIGIQSDFGESESNSTETSFERKGYRSEIERLNWLSRDPLLVIEKSARDNGLTETDIANIKLRIDELVKEATQDANLASGPSLTSLLSHLFA